MDIKQPSWRDLESVIPLSKKPPKKKGDESDETKSDETVDEITVERITSLSEDTIRRHHPDRVRRLSDRRVGMKLRDALAIANGD
jgi:hypothetical protein